MYFYSTRDFELLRKLWWNPGRTCVRPGKRQAESAAYLPASVTLWQETGGSAHGRPEILEPDLHGGQGGRCLILQDLLLPRLARRPDGCALPILAALADVA